MKTIPCPLSDADCAKLTRLLQDCHDTGCILDKLASTGLDVSEFKADNDRMANWARATKAAFFPNNP